VIDYGEGEIGRSKLFDSEAHQSLKIFKILVKVIDSLSIQQGKSLITIALHSSS
jgi:hypothetical protein